MKFVLLGAGTIAEKFVTDTRFRDVLESNLVGLSVSRSVLEEVSKFDWSLPLPKNLISNKTCNENELVHLIDETKPDYLLSIQYPWIIPIKTLRKINGRVLNLHNARLPDYRGHNSISHEILNCEVVHTSTLHWITEEIDRGKIVFAREIPIFEDDTAYSLWLRSVDSAIMLLSDWFEKSDDPINLGQGKSIASGGCYYSKQIASYKRIPPDAGAETIDRWARAFWFPPHEPAFIMYGQKKIYVLPSKWIYEIDLSTSST